MQFEYYEGERIATEDSMPQAWTAALPLLGHVPDLGFISLRLRAFYAQMLDRGMGDPAVQTIEFYAVDWQLRCYPQYDDLSQLVQGLENPELRLGIVDVASKMQEVFGYWMPGSFYQVLVAPALRPNPLEPRMLRYSELDQRNARAWDASLHALLKAADIGLFLQALSSQHGFTMSHGCDCNHLTTEINASGTNPFTFEFPSDGRKWAQVLAYWWHMWWEYATFELQPNTRVGSAYAPSRTV